jgi:hypothetical protein
MALFGRKKKKDRRKHVEQAPPKDDGRKTDQEEAPPRTKSPSHTEANMSMLPELVEHLATSADTSGDRPARALRMLFSLSECAETDNRTEMVRKAGGMLVPELLDFLKRCELGSSEQYLALLVLNNISIPSENKRVSFDIDLL